NWNDGLFDKLRKASFDYYRDFVEEVGMDEMPVINSSAEVFDFCAPSNLIINVYDKNPDDTFVTIELNCEWEIEHGMQWTVKNDDELIFVGPYDGVSIGFAFEIEPNYARKYNPQLSK
ncbi:MAG: hypothetical protein H7Z37_10145, partial [Pyrinomonadaceae bacterium]|nr:hypothetical protein [Pyrinomonadaceae bacterium]